MLRRHLIVTVLIVSACSATGTTPTAANITEPASQTTTVPEMTTTATVVEQPDPVGLGDGIVPWAGNPGYDVTVYDWDMEIDVAEGSVSATAAMTATATDAMDVTALDFTGPAPQEVAFDGSSVPFQHASPKLLIGAGFEAGQSFTVEVAYHGVPEPLGDGRGWTTRENYVYALGALPGDTASWVPLNDTPLDPAVFNVQIATQPEAGAAASGVPTETTGGLRWESPMPISEFGFVAGNLISKEIDGVANPTVTVTVPADSDFPDPTALDDLIPGIIEHLEGFLGPFPFPTLGLTQVDGFGANSTPAQVFFNDFFSPTVIAHEIGHQWIAGAVGTAASRDTWFREGIPEYLAVAWATEQPGSDSLEDRLSALHDEISPSTRVLLEVNTPSDRSSPVTYTRGTLTIHALREAMGDDSFREGLRTFTADFAGRSASTEDFIETMQEHTTVDLDQVVTPWIEQETVPPLP